MQKIRKILATIGFIGLAIFIVGCILNIIPIADGGLILLFTCTAAVLIYSAIKGYSPLEP